MGNVIIDLSNYKDRSGAKVPEGTYRVQVEDLEQTQSKSGNAMITLWLRIIGGEQDGLTLLDRLVLTEKSMFRVVGFLQAIGIPTSKKKMSLNPQSFMGKVLDVQVEDGEPYNGRVKSEVRGYARAEKVAKAKAQEIEEEYEEDEDEVTEDVPAVNSTVEDDSADIEEYEDDEEGEDEDSDEEAERVAAEEAAAKKKKAAAAKRRAKKKAEEEAAAKAAAESEDEDDEDGDEDEDDEDDDVDLASVKL